MADENEMKNLFNPLVGGKSINEFDAREIRSLLNLFDVLRTKLDERKKQLNKHADEKVATETDANDNNGNGDEENGVHP
ncbi:hypothetical protein H5410_052640 [Solanum commersonii]|uniref:Uncharacterized protein n=1 Tax=Solanum commersonii TaxID=4109 RepID=A0A9J5X3L7_SOLCO|nr:hypothetical protein H5410_052640 [Solanum commersonii]